MTGATTWASAPPSVQFGELKAVRKEAERQRSLSWERVERAEDSDDGAAELGWAGVENQRKPPSVELSVSGTQQDVVECVRR